MTIRPTTLRHALPALFAAAQAMVPASAADIALPPETATLQASALPGYALVQRHCMTCHSVHYITTQPAASTRGYWDATVRKMRQPFGARFADADIPAMVEYLSRTYGAEQGGGGTPAAQAGPAAPSLAGDVADLRPERLLAANNCLSCHAVAQAVIGPAFRQVAAKYGRAADAEAAVARSIRAGGAGRWGAVPMPPYSQLRVDEAKSLARYVLSH